MVEIASSQLLCDIPTAHHLRLVERPSLRLTLVWRKTALSTNGGDERVRRREHKNPSRRINRDSGSCAWWYEVVIALV